VVNRLSLLGSLTPSVFGDGPDLELALRPLPEAPECQPGPGDD
jgi:hypothetical protein